MGGIQRNLLLEAGKKSSEISYGYNLHAEKHGDVFINPTEIEDSEERPLIKWKFPQNLILGSTQCLIPHYVCTCFYACVPLRKNSFIVPGQLFFLWSCVKATKLLLTSM